MILYNGVVHPMDAGVIDRGYVAIEGGKITAVGPVEELDSLPADAVDVAGGHILPGFVDAHCHLGMFGDGLGFEADDGNEATDPCTPQLRAIDGVNLLDRCFAEARQAGVTAVVTGPGSANPVAGQLAALKTDGRWVEQALIKAPVAMKFALGENPKTVYNERKESPVTRMATAAIIRENLSKAVEYRDKQSKADAVAGGSLAAHFHAHRADDIATALRIAREFGVRAVIVHGTEGHLIPELLRQEGAAVITGPCLTDRSKPELANQSLEAPAILARAGVAVAICTDHPETPIQFLPLCAAMAVRGGMEEEQALSAITLNAARIAGIDSRVGSLTPGKDADVVVTDGYPLDWKSRVRGVWINGRQVAGISVEGGAAR